MNQALASRIALRAADAPDAMQLHALIQANLEEGHCAGASFTDTAFTPLKDSAAPAVGLVT